MESDNYKMTEEVIKENDINKGKQQNENEIDSDNNVTLKKTIKEDDIYKKEEIENKFSFKSFYEKKKVTVIEYIVFTVFSLGLTVFLTIQLGIVVYNFAKDKDFKLNGLTKDEFFGGYRDFSIFVWRAYRTNLSTILIFSTIMVTINQLLKRFSNLVIVKIFYLLFGLGFSFFLHKLTFIYVFLFLVLEYILCFFYPYLGKICFIILTWVICIAIKAGIELQFIFNPPVFLDFLPYYDDIKGPFLSYDVVFQFIMLKTISFNMEYSTMYENETNKMEKLNEEKNKHFQKCKDCQQGYFCPTTLKKYIILKQSDFSFFNYLIYTLYPPFYIAGPTIMYHTFIFQLQNKESKHYTIFFKKKVLYIIKCLVIFVVMEIYNHFIYVNVLLNEESNEPALIEFKNKYPHYIYYFLIFNTLVAVFLKYEVIWKISRLWGWMDGICCEENINRCIYNNYSFEGFWRQWHRSFNIWLIRYMYIPMGGSKYKFLNTFVIFSFVALWHEVKLHLLVWGWTIYLTLIPEIIIKRYFNKKERQNLTKYFWFRYLRAFACSIDILLLVLSNLCGYGLEHDKIVETFKEILNIAGFFGILGFLGFFAMNSFSMFFVRDLEEAMGIKKNY